MLVVMVLQLNYDEVRNALHDAGYWFGAIIVLWAALYVLNTTSWMLIIKAGGKTHIPFWWLLVVAVTNLIFSTNSIVAFVTSYIFCGTGEMM